MISSGLQAPPCFVLWVSVVTLSDCSSEREQSGSPAAPEFEILTVVAELSLDKCSELESDGRFVVSWRGEGH